MAARALLLPALLVGLAAVVAPPAARRAEPAPVRVSGGEGFLAHQLVPLYLVPVRERSPREGWENVSLDPRHHRATARTDADGRLTPTDLGTPPPGLYQLIADYNGDARFTSGLDAFSFVEVPPAGGRSPALVQTLAASPRRPHYTQPVTLRATVRVLDGRPVVAGVVDFHEGSRYLGSAAVGPDGTAVLVLGDLLQGLHDILALYGQADTESWAATTVEVLPNETAVTLTTGRTEMNYRDFFEVDALVSVKSALPQSGPIRFRPRGAIRLRVEGGDLDYRSVGPDGRAKLTVSGLERGTWSITARYDGDGVFAESSSDPVRVTVTNNPPTAHPIAVATTGGRPVRLTRWLHTLDEDGDPTHIARLSTPAHGTATVADEVMTYIPKPGFTGEDAFTYTVGDDWCCEGMGTVTVRVYPAGGGSRVFADPAGTGAEAADARGLRYVLVSAVDGAGKTVADALTDANGFYELPTNVPAGTYRLRFKLPDNIRPIPFSPRGRGGKARGSDVDAAGLSDPVRFDPTAGWPAVNAGLVLDPTDRAFDFLFE